MKNFFSLVFIVAAVQLMGWGANGHRVTGQIAELHLSKKAKKNITAIMGDESLALASTWMDEIKSDPSKRHMNAWHYVSIPDSLLYEDSEKNPQGDIIESLGWIVDSLKKGGMNRDDERDLIRMLVHLVGDLHQPLHVGRKEDKGGNDIRVQWFGKSSNLHRVWDSDMIRSYEMSYSELAANLPQVDKNTYAEWTRTGVLDWAEESMSYRESVYELPDSKKLGYAYSYAHFGTVKLRLLQAGVRLAGILNDIYG